MPKISVIIPVYNTEQYLPICLDSICAQTLEDIEIICINDCSPDNAVCVLQEYAARDSRVNIIDFAENKGVAVARNAGIDAAIGEYVAFIDSDDFVDVDFYEKLYTKAVETGAEVVKGTYKLEKSKAVNSSLNIKIKEEKTNFAYEHCSCIFNRVFLLKHNLKYPTMFDMEDPLFSFSVALKANKVETLYDAYVTVCERENSATAGIPSFDCVVGKFVGLEKMIELANSAETLSISSYSYVLSLWFVITLNNATINKTMEARTFIANKVIELYQKIQYKKAFLTEISSFSKLCVGLLQGMSKDDFFFYAEKKEISELQSELLDIKRTNILLRKENTIFLKKYLYPLIVKNSENSESINFITVVNDYTLYNEKIVKNSFVNLAQNIVLNAFDNTKENKFISVRYNEFLNSYDYLKESWFVFCHSDWELLDDINGKLRDLDKNYLYGGIGGFFEKMGNKYSRSCKGKFSECMRNGDKYKLFFDIPKDNIVDTFDCQCIIVHSSLVAQYNLRFDENLEWDLYVEDFCINVRKKYNILSKAIDLFACHWSDAGYKTNPPSYYKSLEYINRKYFNDAFNGTVSVIGGKEIEIATAKEVVFFKLRKRIENVKD